MLRRFSADTPHRTVRAVFPHTALRVGLVSSVSLPFAPRLRFTLIPMDAPPCGRAVSDAPPHSGLSPIAVFRHYCSRHLICIVPFTRRGPSHPRALPRFPATTASSDSSLRFRYNEVSRVPLLNFPDTRSSYVPRGRLRVASRSPSATCPPLRSGAFRFDHPSRFDGLLLASW